MVGGTPAMVGGGTWGTPWPGLDGGGGTWGTPWPSLDGGSQGTPP